MLVMPHDSAEGSVPSQRHDMDDRVGPLAVGEGRGVSGSVSNLQATTIANRYRNTKLLT